MSDGIDYRKLYKWCVRQRQQLKKGVLPPDYISLLDSVGFEWDPRDRDWLAFYNRALEYQKNNGSMSGYSRDRPLAKWVSRQVRLYKRGLLGSEHQKKLEGLGVNLSPLVVSSFWDSGVRMLNDYVEEYGAPRDHLGRLAMSHDRSGRVGVFLSMCRKEHRVGRLTSERVEFLRSLGVSMQPDDDRWFAFLARCGEEIGSGLPLSDGVYGWLCRQRLYLREGKLPTYKISALKRAGIPLTPSEGRLDYFVRRLRECETCTRLGTLDRGMVKWLNAVRHRFRRGKLSEGHIEALKEVGFDFKCDR